MMTRSPKLRRVAVAATLVALLPRSVEARIDTPPGMQTDATNASNPAALQNLTGGTLTYNGSSLSSVQTGDTSWQTTFTNYPLIPLVVAKHGSGNAAILGYEYNDLPNATVALPSAILGYSKLDPTHLGNQVFSYYGQTDLPSGLATGVGIGAEFTCNNNAGAPDTALPPNQSINTPSIVCNGLQLSQEGNFDSSIGLRISRNGISTVNWSTGIYLTDYSVHGIYLGTPASGATDTLRAGGLFSVNTGTSTSTVSFGGTNNSSNTGTLIGLNSSQNFNPAGASVSAVRGQSNGLTVSGSALTIANVFDYYGTINTGAGYTGTITAGHNYYSADAALSGTNPITSFFGFHQAAVSNGSGNASGTVTNTGLKIDPFTATAGSGGTINNNGLVIAMPSGTNAGTTTNIGLSITGSGQGGGATNWAINSTSTAASQFAGPVNLTAGGTLTDTTNQAFEVSTSTLTKTSDTALAVAPGLSQTLTAGKTYSCRGHLTGTAGASGGIKAALVATGGLTATQTTWTGFTWNGTTAVANTTVTALGANIAASTAVYSDVWIDGSIVVNGGGTINVEAAQNASNATSTTVLQGSTFSCVRVN